MKNAFSECLNGYIAGISCSLAELAACSGLSPASVTRYCSGERAPKYDSEAFAKLVRGLTELAAKKDCGLSETEIRSTLGAALGAHCYVDFADHFDRLIDALQINLTELAKNINFNASYLSRVRSGQRTPANMDSFVDALCRYIVRRYADETSVAAAAALIGCKKTELYGMAYYSALTGWFGRELSEKKDNIDGFLKKVDEFDLDEFIDAIHFNDIKLPSMPFRLPTSKSYYGLEQMREGELDFFKSTVLSRSHEDIFMCADMPMEDMAEDMDFGKKWMLAIAMCVKKGLHINIIHNVDRPFREMLLGLESWIPIYMTGQISPYHFKNPGNGVYQHLNYVSGAAALCGECVSGHHADGKYYLTNNKEELAWYRKKSEALLAKAQPLMEIYREADRARLEAFLASAAQARGTRRNILSAPPLYTLDEALLERMLTRSGAGEEEKGRLLAFIAEYKAGMEQILAADVVTDELAEPDEAHFAEKPVTLPLSELFFEREIKYTFEEYTEHLAATQRFAEKHGNYRLHLSGTQVFRNIQIHILEDKWVLISKNKSPVIHFVIRHPKMVSALQNFIVPVED